MRCLECILSHLLSLSLPTWEAPIHPFIPSSLVFLLSEVLLDFPKQSLLHFLLGKYKLDISKPFSFVRIIFSISSQIHWLGPQSTYNTRSSDLPNISRVLREAYNFLFFEFSVIQLASLLLPRWGPAPSISFQSTTNNNKKCCMEKRFAEVFSIREGDHQTIHNSEKPKIKYLVFQILGQPPVGSLSLAISIPRCHLLLCCKGLFFFFSLPFSLSLQSPSNHLPPKLQRDNPRILLLYIVEQFSAFFLLFPFLLH